MISRQRFFSFPTVFSPVTMCTRKYLCNVYEKIIRQLQLLFYQEDRSYMGKSTTRGTGTGGMNRSTQVFWQITSRDTAFNMFNSSLQGLKCPHHTVECIIRRCIPLIFVSIPLPHFTTRFSWRPHFHNLFLTLVKRILFLTSYSGDMGLPYRAGIISKRVSEMGKINNRDCCTGCVSDSYASPTPLQVWLFHFCLHVSSSFMNSKTKTL